MLAELYWFNIYCLHLTQSLVSQADLKEGGRDSEVGEIPGPVLLDSWGSAWTPSALTGGLGFVWGCPRTSPLLNSSFPKTLIIFIQFVAIFQAFRHPKLIWDGEVGRGSTPASRFLEGSVRWLWDYSRCFWFLNSFFFSFQSLVFCQKWNETEKLLGESAV